MKTRKILLAILGVTFWLALGYASNMFGYSFFSSKAVPETEETSTAPNENETDDKNTIQVALLLDTSGSMSGLIEQAKAQLWNILNELARTEKDGDDTKLEIALYEYGNPSKSKEANQINRLTEFTTDMDMISEKLFALRTNGGEEYCGTVIQTSLEELEWKNKEGLKIIYIAGNEEFTQGMFSYEKACKNARDKGVTINTIYCGEYSEGLREYWKKGAMAGGGEYLNINHNQETVYVPTPYDDKINKLNEELNKTYIPFGKKGKEKKLNQTMQDKNSYEYSTTNAADRATFKSSKKYKNTDWDLVDAYEKDKKILKNVEVHADTLQNISVEELEAQIQEVSIRRTNIQNEIQELDKKRRKYKAENTKTEDKTSLQQNMIKSIKKQAKEKGYKTKE